MAAFSLGNHFDKLQEYCNGEFFKNSTFLNELTQPSMMTFLLYLIIYNVTLYLLLFAILCLRSNSSSLHSLFLQSRTGGLNYVFTILLISLAGVPPLGGFFPKVSIFSLLTNDYFIYWFLLTTPIVLLGMYFYLTNARALLSLSSESPVQTSTWRPTPPSIVFASAILFGAVFILDELFLVLIWLLF